MTFFKNLSTLRNYKKKRTSFELSYSLCWTEKITKKVYNNVLNSMKVWYEINAISMNSENSKTSEPYRILLNSADKINQERSDKYVALSNLSM